MSKEKKKKSNKKRRHLPYIQKTTIPNQVLKARNYPISECYIADNWQKNGMCQVFVLREKPDNHIIMGVYLVDIWCLGLKNTYCNIDFSRHEIDDVLYNRNPDTIIETDTDTAHSMIYGGIDYADKLGFQPHADFKITKYILEPREDINFDDTIEFGKDGKPFFFAGPNDTKEKISKVLAQLNKSAGEGSFDFAYPADL